ncbi:MXAN_6640 family putative metalloprotease [Nocardioides mangrovi]|uniref:Uncharacterized protein n=1 Tax=Nocardioides mangrovi TaxID=2874580 RepID=A0ABS7U9S2_9ACTN|nr:MXAN_6640 family putative metalloprotease [Nocardioides mangrovi]MBZ5737701.1 hypothetical protein [Nocardioides mangrovi]
MLPGPRLLFPTLISALSTALVAGVLTAAPATATAVADPEPEGSTAVAEQALATVEAALAPTAGARAEGRSTAPTETGTDLTMALRDLRIHQDELTTSAERARAAALLNNRPPTTSDWSDPQQRDFGSVRVHWDAGTAGNQWVSKVADVVKHVLATYDKAGYRAPESDGTRGGGNGLFDVYLDDLGPSYYGYCSTDQEPSDPGPYDTWAYCAFNTDYSWASAHTPLQNLKVTAAHEIFHAVQFAYDYFEDPWFYEATATWAEDELYTSINDNRQYLQDSPISNPTRPLDLGNGLSVYGGWIFFRYLTERFPRTVGGLPVIIRKIWEDADSVTGPDDYSIQAVTKVLADHDVSLRRVLADFAVANRRPAASYAEGKHYPQAPLRRTVTLTKAHRSTDWATVRLDHLATSTLAVAPGSGLASGWSLKIGVDLPNTKLGSAALVTVYRTHGDPRTHLVKLGKRGNGDAKVSFGSRAVDHVEITLTNAGTAYRCWQSGGAYSCHGRSKDDNRAMKWKVQAVRS